MEKTGLETLHMDSGDKKTMEYRVIKRSKVVLGKELIRVSDITLKAAQTIFVDTLQPFCQSMLPIVLPENDTYILIARHLAFRVLIQEVDSLRIPVFLASLVENKASLIKADEILLHMIDEQATKHDRIERKKRAVGLSRMERKKIGYICPFCKLLVKAKQGSMPVKEGNYKGYYLITCFSENTKEVPCGFAAYLSVEEYILFKNRQYPVFIWLQRTDKKCPACGNSLFLRTRFSKKHLLCEDNFRLTGKCKYRESVEGV
jgi:hypothetical protein